MDPRPGSPEERFNASMQENAYCEHHEYVRISEYCTITCRNCSMVWEPNDPGFDEAAQHVTRPKPERERVGSKNLNQCSTGGKSFCPDMVRELSRESRGRGLVPVKRWLGGNTYAVVGVGYRRADKEIVRVRYCMWCGKKV